jgi:diguanylate cyclase (GGDEF)-like protein
VFFSPAAQITAIIKNRSFLSRNIHIFIIWPAIVLLVSLIAWSSLSSKLEEDRQQLETNAFREAGLLARGYADQLARSLEAIDQIILHVKYEWELTDGQLQLETIAERGLFPPDALFRVAIVNREGLIVSSTFIQQTDPGAIVSMADRPYFLFQQHASGDTLFIGDPTLGRNSGKPVIQFSRRLNDKTGAFAGVVLVSISPTYFTDSYDAMAMGQNGILAVIGENGVIRTARKGMMQEHPDAHIFAALPPVFEEREFPVLKGDTWFTDKRSRYVGWQPVKRFPLIALTGLDEADAFAEYQEERNDAMYGMQWATFGLAALGLLAMIIHFRLAWRRYQFVNLQETYRIATEGGKEGFYILRPIKNKAADITDFEVLDCNQRGAELFQRQRQAFIGLRLSDLQTGIHFERQMALLCRALEKGAFESEEEGVPGSSFLPRWTHVKILRSGTDLAVTVRDISDAKAHIEELERRGNHDALTELPNRHWVQAYLPQAIAQASERKDMLALLYIDLDGFKGINDTLGHAAGDELLLHVAQRLRVAVRPQDHIVRLGGDEFVVILERLENKNDAAQVAQRILDAFNESFRLASGVRAIGVSVGIGMYPDNGEAADILLQHADFAMYSVKMRGKGTYCFYDPTFYETFRARLEKERELRHAIAQDQFILYYQPRVDVRSGMTCSMEALVRWRHPEKGILNPHDFIPLAEETGLILDLGELVITKACGQLAQWTAQGRDPVPVSINVSARQFHETNIKEIFRDSLEKTGVSPKLVEIEVTESVMMGEDPALQRALSEIQEMGIKICIDDFGTGYSSLSQLQQMDFDVLKVDRAFTVDVDRTDRGNIFVKAIITMAHALGMRVVAEGVENEEQMRVLKSMRCDEVQGFYISHPLTAAEMLKRLPPANIYAQSRL